MKILKGYVHAKFAQWGQTCFYFWWMNWTYANHASYKQRWYFVSDFFITLYILLGSDTLDTFTLLRKLQNYTNSSKVTLNGNNFVSYWINSRLPSLFYRNSSSFNTSMQYKLTDLLHDKKLQLWCFMQYINFLSVVTCYIMYNIIKDLLTVSISALCTHKCGFMHHQYCSCWNLHFVAPSNWIKQQSP